MVIPLNRGSQTLGVIDIHSPNPNAFTGKEDNLFMGLADQLAIAIEKAAVQQEMRETLEELETAYGSFTQSSWERFIQTRQNISGYRFNQRKKVEEVSQPPEEVIQAWTQGESVNVKKKVPGSNAQTSSLAIPLKVRGSVIGVLDVGFETDTIPVDTTNLIEEISERLSLILENARLIETAQRQVERERLTSDISNSIRQSLDLDVVLRTAVQEIGQKLGLSEVELRLGDQMQARLDGAKAPNGKKPKPSEEAA
ncbi:MAG: GAF domain-containing protein [Thermoleophilia bacterium]|nr:GAF domain-containing protein [Thermoleophilia bacterium]